MAAGARAQRRPSKIAILSGFTDQIQNQMRVGAFKEQLRTLGWVEGANLVIDQRQTGGLDELRRAASGTSRTFWDVRCLVAVGAEADIQYS
jgi:hypothetical protein